MANKVQVNLNGTIVTIIGEETNEYINKIVGYFDEKVVAMREYDVYKTLDRNIITGLITINIVDELFKLRDTHKKASETLEELSSKVKSFDDKNKELVSKKSENENELERVKGENKNLQKNIDTLNEEKQYYDSKFLDFQKIVENLRAENTALELSKKELLFNNSEISRLKMSLQNHTSVSAEKEKIITSLATKIKELENNEKTLQNNISVFKNRLNITEKECEDYLDKITTLQTENLNTKNSYEEKLRNFKIEYDIIKKTKNELEGFISTLEQKNELLKKNYSDNSNLEIQIEKALNEKNAVLDRVDELNEKINAMENDFQLRAENKERQVNILKAESDKIKSENLRLVEQLNAIKTKKDNFENDYSVSIKNKEQQIDILKNQLEISKNQIATLEIENNAATTNLDKVKKYNTDLENDLNTVVVKKQKEINDLKVTIEKVTAEMNVMKNEYFDMQKITNDAEENKKNVEDSFNDEIEKIKTQHENEIVMLTSSFNKEKNAEFKTISEIHAKELLALKNKIANKEAETSQVLDEKQKVYENLTKVENRLSTTLLEKSEVEQKLNSILDNKSPLKSGEENYEVSFYDMLDSVLQNGNYDPLKTVTSLQESVINNVLPEEILDDKEEQTEVTEYTYNQNDNEYFKQISDNQEEDEQKEPSIEIKENSLVENKKTHENSAVINFSNPVIEISMNNKVEPEQVKEYVFGEMLLTEEFIAGESVPEEPINRQPINEEVADVKFNSLEDEMLLLAKEIESEMDPNSRFKKVRRKK